MLATTQRWYLVSSPTIHKGLLHNRAVDYGYSRVNNTDNWCYCLRIHVVEGLNINRSSKTSSLFHWPPIHLLPLSATSGILLFASTIPTWRLIKDMPNCCVSWARPGGGKLVWCTIKLNGIQAVCEVSCWPYVRVKDNMHVMVTFSDRDFSVYMYFVILCKN